MRGRQTKRGGRKRELGEIGRINIEAVWETEGDMGAKLERKHFF